ncbi:hypothetical protein PMAYCL1PPCAC_26328, partial [Pristionchus mayeri]
EMEKQFRDSRVHVVFTSENLLQKVMDAAKNCPDVKAIICVRSYESSLPGGIVDFNRALIHAPLLQFETVSLDDPAIILYSSGTTGEPKGTVISHRSLNANITGISSHWEHEIFPCMGVDKVDWAKEYQIVNLPFYHIFGNGLMNWF